MAKNAAARQADKDPALPQRKRAQRRVIGAAALAIAAAIILTLVLDSEPRQPVPEIEVSIPPRVQPARLPKAPEMSVRSSAESDRSGLVQGQVVEPARVPAIEPKPDVSAVQAPEASPAPKLESPAVAAPSQSPGMQPADDGGKAESVSAERASETSTAAVRRSGSPAKKRSPGADLPVAAKSQSEPAMRRAEEAGAKTVSDSDPAAKPQAAGSGTKPPAASAGRYSVQVGAFATAPSAQTQLERVRKAGLPAYTETILTAQGKRIRVRAGPFETYEQAERARARLKLAGVESAIIKP